MEERILAILNEKFGEINKKFDEMKQEISEKYDDLRQEISGKYDSLRQELSEKHDNLRQELNEKHDNLRQELNEKHDSLKEDLRKELLDYMFLFEENYGRKINIMYEELTAKMQKDRMREENVLVLEKRVDKNSAFVFSHENRITALERTKK